MAYAIMMTTEDVKKMHNKVKISSTSAFASVDIFIEEHISLETIYVTTDYTSRASARPRLHLVVNWPAFAISVQWRAVSLL